MFVHGNEDLFSTMAAEVLAMQGDIKTQSCRVTHICISKLTSIGSDSGLLPDTKPLSEPMVGYCFFFVCLFFCWDIVNGPLGTNLCEILNLYFLLKKCIENVVWKMAILSQCVDVKMMSYQYRNSMCGKSCIWWSSADHRFLTLIKNRLDWNIYISLDKWKYITLNHRGNIGRVSATFTFDI